MTPDGKGVYRWRYSVNLYRNPGLLWLFYKVFGGIFAGCMLFVLFLGDFKVSPEGVKWGLVGFAVMKGVQVANEAKRNKVLGTVVAVMGAATGNLTQMGVGTMVAADDERYSQFATVSKVKPDRKHNTINIHNGLFHNQVFVGDEDFDFVLDYITSHSPKLLK